MLTPLLMIGGGLLAGFLFLKKRQEDKQGGATGDSDDLKPGMTGLLGGTATFGLVVIASPVLGWTNVLPEQNARIRSEFPTGARVNIRGPGNKVFHAVANGDGPQGGRFFRAS